VLKNVAIKRLKKTISFFRAWMFIYVCPNYQKIFKLLNLYSTNERKQQHLKIYLIKVEKS